MEEWEMQPVTLPKQTAAMFRRCMALLAPPPKLTLSEWADKYRVLSAESSAEPGRWHTDKAPYQREIMDAIGDHKTGKIIIMSAAQIGKTDAFILNVIGYYMAYYPAPIMVMQPTLDMGQTFSKDRLAPMVRDTPELRGLVDTKSRDSGNTIMKKNFPGGHITIVGANSPSGLASRPIKVLLCDEVDRYPTSAGTEGDPLGLAQKRQTTFWDKKTVMVSTPVIKGQSREFVEEYAQALLETAKCLLQRNKVRQTVLVSYLSSGAQRLKERLVELFQPTRREGGPLIILLALLAVLGIYIV